LQNPARVEDQIVLCESSVKPTVIGDPAEFIKALHPIAWGAEIVVDGSGIMACICDSSLLPEGRLRALALFDKVMEVAVRADTAAVPTDDDGMTLEFSSEETGRDLLFAIPDDGSVRYFTARGPDGFRRAGIVKDDCALTSLSRWLMEPDAKFPSVGLDVG
jgi:hypothetical protein